MLNIVMTVCAKVSRWLLVALLVFQNVPAANSDDLPAWEFDRETVTKFDIRDELATPIVHAFEASTGQAKNSMAARLYGTIRASGNWAVFSGEISAISAAEMKSVPLAALFLKSPNGWLVVDFAGGEKFKQIHHWTANFDMPGGLLEELPTPRMKAKSEVEVVEPASTIETGDKPTPDQKTEPVVSESSSELNKETLTALRAEYQQLQEEYLTLQNQQQELPKLRDPISDDEIARNAKKFDAMGKDFSSLKDAYIESVEREREKHILAKNLRKAIDTTKVRLDEIARQLQSAKKE